MSHTNKNEKINCYSQANFIINLIPFPVKNMKIFDSRNVLDRIETTFTTLFNAKWKRNFSPFLIILAINIVG